MQDRYLFKAKRKDDGEWVFGGLSYCEKTNAYFITNMGKDHISYIGFHQEVDSNTICQCTGLKDNNGKLIWENDIMVAHLDDRFQEDATYTRVVWNNNGFCTKEQGSEDISPLDKFGQEYFKVCGNLFDNPELLEVGE